MCGEPISVEKVTAEEQLAIDSIKAGGRVAVGLTPKVLKEVQDYIANIEVKEDGLKIFIPFAPESGATLQIAKNILRARG